jgi:hypothetical protein
VLTPVPASAGIAGKGLRTIDPARYGTLHHPGDGFAFDIYTQIARALANGDGLGDLHPDRVLAVGESQSAAMLVAYTNGVQPLAHAFDGLLIHSRGAGAGPIAKPGEPVDVIAAFSGSPTVIRDDLDVPVFVMNTETDVAVLGASRSRQEDTDRFRLWEIAGAAHADRTNLGFTADAIDCGGPVNDGPQQFVARAALRSLDHWVRDGTLPVHADPLTLGADPATAQRDGDGIILGGIRTPVVDVPTVVLSGEPRPATALVCLLSGKTDPIPTDRLAQRYPSRAAYLDEYTKSTDATIDRGFLLPEDRAAMLDKAQPDLIPG